MFDNISKMKSHFQTIFAVVIAFAVIAFWRGVWGLLDIYLFPGKIELSLWASVVLGIAILAATHYVTKLKFM
jgi:hypothetical protein